MSKTQDTRSLPPWYLPSNVMVLNLVGTDLFCRQLLKICGNGFDCQMLVDAVGIGWARVRGTRCPVVYRAGPHSEELFFVSRDFQTS